MKLRSLRSRLVRDLVYLQLLAGALVSCGFLSWFWASGSINDEYGEEATQVVLQALDRRPDGRLMLRPTAALSELRKLNPYLWFIVRDPAGTEVLTEGSVPTRFVQLSAVLSGTDAALIGERQRGQIEASAHFSQAGTKVGTLNVLVQTRASLPLFVIVRKGFFSFLVLVAPMTVVSILAVVLATPWMVGRELRGLAATASRAERIDVHDRTTRLPLDDVAEEILPLVHAVNRAFDRLNDGYALQERFLVDAAHELRTPITVLQVRMDGLADDRLKSKLMHDVARLGTLAEQLLDLQRLHNAPASLTAPIDLKALCERMGADLAPLAIQSDCIVSVDAPWAVSTPGDAPSLERAIANLVQNAIEHGGQGCEIQIRAFPPSSIEVNDSGPGIPESQRETVTAPFHRLKPRGRGAGLGLHLVTEVVKLHRGRMSIGTSELGGASIRLDLNVLT